MVNMSVYKGWERFGGHIIAIRVSSSVDIVKSSNEIEK